MKTVLTIIFSLLASVIFAQSPGDLPPNIKPGSCYAKCLIEDSFDEYEIEVPVYTGDPDDKTVKRKKKTIVIQDESSKWVKRKADPRCMSKDPDDCLVWCLVEIPAIKEERIVVKKPSKTSEYEMEVFTIKELIKGGTEWQEVLCEKDVHDYTIREIQMALVEQGYLQSGNFERKHFTEETSKALKEFQRDNGLPIGNFNLETLDELGIDY